jgi:hypothetical protein
VTVDTHGLAPGVYSASLFLQSNSGRNPSIRIPVSLVVPSYQVAANSGGGSYTDSNGDGWSRDQAFTPGSWGYLGQSRAVSSRHAISGTVDDPLYQNLRENAYEYRFDGLAPGVYQIELRFAELAPTQPNSHLFDVIIENNLALSALDIAAEVGSFAADDKSFFVNVTDGQLNVRFITRRGFGQPIVNAVRVTSRPDHSMISSSRKTRSRLALYVPPGDAIDDVLQGTGAGPRPRDRRCETRSASSPRGSSPPARSPGWSTPLSIPTSTRGNRTFGECPCRVISSDRFSLKPLTSTSVHPSRTMGRGTSRTVSTSGGPVGDRRSHHRGHGCWRC